MALTPSQELAAWLRANQDKRGTPDYETVLRGFQEAVLQESALQPQPLTPAEKYGNWLLANQHKRGTPDYETVLRAFQVATLEELGHGPRPQEATRSSVPKQPGQPQDSLRSDAQVARQGNTGSEPVLSRESGVTPPASIDFTGAAGAAVAGPLIAIVVGAFVYRAIIKGYKSRMHRLLLTVGLVVFCLGLGAALNEVIHSVLMGYSVRPDEVLKLIPGTAILLLVWVALGLLRSKRSDDAALVLSRQASSGKNRDVDQKSLSQDALECWKRALEEHEGPGRQAGLWAKLYADHNGDESRAKADYLRIRAEHFGNSRSDDSYGN